MFFKNFFKKEVKEDTSFDDFFKESAYQLEQVRKRAQKEKEFDDDFFKESEYQKELKRKFLEECDKFFD